ncbi:MAG: T9SS type A sorting domain-containing protein [Ignavibacteriales bacterium]|nr:T9SS type A sorting domain-containing protein [Ignavibacteriales bacterium]
MKHIFTIVLLFVAVLMLGGTTSAQLLLVEDFNYPSGDTVEMHGWTVFSGANSNPLTIQSTAALTYSGYANSGIGNGLNMANSGEDAYKLLSTPVTSGTYYMAAMVNISAALTGDYFLSPYCTGGTGGGYFGRIFAKSDGAGGFYFGVSKNVSSSTANYEATARSFGTTYLIVLKYTFNTGSATDDLVDFWVNPAIGGLEPAATIAGVGATQSDVTNALGLNTISIRQATSTGSPTLKIDGIRVGTSWAAVVASPSSSASDILAAGNETSNIDYASYQSASVTTTSDALRVFSFTVRDGGGSPDGDTYPTILSGITFNKGAGNGVTNWANTIRQAALFNGSTKVAEVSVTGETIVFSGMSGADVTAADDGSTTLDLYLTFESAVTDNQQFEFQVTNTNVTPASSGSSTFTGFTAQTSSVTGDANRLEVTATKLAFSTQPPVSVAVNNSFSSAVEARDANENVDADYATNFDLSVATGTGTLSSVTGLSQAPTSGAASWSDLKYNTAETGVSIQAASGSLTSATSNTFDVTGASAASDVVAGVLTIPLEISSLDDTQAEEVAMFDFTVRDGGGSADADPFATIVTALSVVPGSLNNISDWSTYVLGAELYDGASLVGTGTVSAASIAFSGSPLASVADDGSTTLTLKLWLKNPLPVGADGKMFQAKINQNTDVTLDPLGSMMVAGGSDVVGGTGTEVSVNATELRFVANIANTKVSTNFTASAKATDANGNIDVDFVAAVTFAKASGTGNLTGTTAPLAVLGVATTTDLQLDAGGAYTLSADAAGLTGATSNSFVVETPTAVFKVANVLGDTLMWRDPTTWFVETGFDADNIPDNDYVYLNNDYKTGSYVVKIGYMTTSDSFYTMQIGYPGNTNEIKLLIPYVSTSQASTSFRYGDGLVGNIDLLIDEGGVLQNNTARTSGNNLFVRGYTPANDTTLIRTGGKYLHMTLATTSFVKTLSNRLDGDYGIFEWACPASVAAPSITSSMIWYPHLVFSGVNGATVYKLYTSSTPGPMYVKGNITINSGIADTMNITGSYAVALFGNIINNGSMAFTTSPLIVRGTAPQTISGNPVYLGNGMVMANAAGLTLGNDLTVKGGTVQATGTYNFDKGGAIFETLTCAGAISTGLNTVYLNPAGALNEGDNPIQGNVSATRTAVQATNELFGGIGFEINAADAAPGVTTVVRKNGVASTGNGNQSILRYYDVTPTNNTGLNATTSFSYATGELNSLDENTLMLFKSEDGGTTWSGKAGTVNSPLNKITATGINSFSRWTAGSYNSPLFISHTITVMKIEDKDGDLNTTGDQVPKKWRLNLYQGATLINSQNLNTGVMVTPNLEAGTYTATEEDSIGWLHLGVRVNGVLTTGSMNTADVTVSGGVSAEIIFYNQKASSLTAKKYRDYDGDAGTTADQVATPWGLSIYKGTISEGTLVLSTTTGEAAITDIQAGTYIVVEEDKGSAWKRINGNLAIRDTVIVAGGDDAVVTFVNFKPNSLTIRKVKDSDGKLSTNNDRVLAPWHLEVRRGTISGALVASSDNGSLDVPNLGDDTYVIVESDSANWINLGYTINSTDHASTDNNYTIALSDGMNTIFDFVNAPPIYSNMYRSFDPDSIAQSKDLKLKYKYIARKANADEFVFDLTAPDTAALTLKFSMLSTGVVLNGVDTVGTWTSAKLATTSAIDSGDVVTVIGWGYSGKPVKTGYSWATLPKATKGTVGKEAGTYTMNQPRLPMPNRLNAVNDLFALAQFPTGLQVGMDKSSPDSTKLFGWLSAKKYSDVAKTLNDGKTTHTTPAHSLDAWTSTGKPLLKMQKSLPPTKFNNVLLAQMIALKLNITASNLEMIPLGFGELMFDDATLTPPVGAPVLNGMMVREIASLVDSLMMGWAHVDTIIKGKPVYSRHFHDPAVMAFLNTAVTKINNAFEGQLDTTSFASALVFTGAKKLIDVPYLKGSSVVPAKIVPDYTMLEQIPEAYKLHQNYPNPFNPTTMIQFDLPEEAFVTLKVYNLLGQEVATLFNREQMSEGTQEVEFSASSFASGVYFYRLSAEGIGEEGTTSGTFNSVHKMILVK